MNRLVLILALVFAGTPRVASAQYWMGPQLPGAFGYGYGGGYGSVMAGLQSFAYEGLIRTEFQIRLGRAPLPSELSKALGAFRIAGLLGLRTYMFTLPSAGGGASSGPLSRRECLDFDFAAQSPSAALRSRIQRTAKAEVKILYQRALFVLHHGDDAGGMGTATWVREQILANGYTPPITPADGSTVAPATADVQPPADLGADAATN